MGRDGMVGECKCSSFSDRSTADHAHMFAVCSFQFIPAKFAKKSEICLRALCLSEEDSPVENAFFKTTLR